MEQGPFWVLVVLFSAMLLGSAVRLIWLQATQNSISRETVLNRRHSLGVWWVLAICFACALTFGRIGLSILFCSASLLALREFVHIVGKRRVTHSLLGATVGAIAVLHYGAAAVSESLWSYTAFPFISLTAITLVLLKVGGPSDYLYHAAGYFWASSLMILGLSYAVATTRLSDSAGGWDSGSIGWCIYLVLLTETNDIAQALVGRSFGSHKLAPTFSPGKTWEGLVGGFVVTCLLAVLSAPWLTTLTLARPYWQAILVSLAAGSIIALCGFLGGLNMSGFKRDAGVKDSGRLLPGMGGMIDRIDSLTVSAPAFYYFVVYINSASP
jgi:phosphatidate cytidylyltransferase